MKCVAVSLCGKSCGNITRLWDGGVIKRHTGTLQVTRAELMLIWFFSFAPRLFVVMKRK